MTTPRTDFDGRYSDPEATAVAWADAEADLRTAELYWLTTVRADGRPHVTPLIAVWLDGALHISTGRSEQKSRNIAEHGAVAVTTGRNDLAGSRDLVVEGDAVRVTDGERLQELAVEWETKYGPDWHFEVGDGGFVQRGNPDVWVFRIEPTVAYAFGKAPYSQTRFSWSRIPPLADV